MSPQISSIHTDVWLFPRVWGAMLLALVFLTYPLWISPPGATYPSIPLWSGFEAASFLAIPASLILLVALALAIAMPNRFRWAWWLVAVCLLITFLTDQHRLQPWAYQSCLYALVFASMNESVGRRFLIPLAASVYIFSAAGKLDFQFSHTVGQEFLETIAAPLGGIPESIDLSVRNRLALVMPGVELIAGICLLPQITRRWSAMVLIVMHLTLIAMLGPWSLDHSRGVLIWNGMLIAQAILLMMRHPPSPTPSPETESAHSPGCRLTTLQWIVGGVIAVGIFAPLSERSGYWDHWTSWSLYSPHTSRAEVELHQSVIGTLPPEIERYLLEDSDGDGWRRLSLEQWSLADRFVPLYPQARYQLALAARLARDRDWDREMRVRLRGIADRWTGEREDRRLLGKQQVDKALNHYWLQHE